MAPPPKPPPPDPPNNPATTTKRLHKQRRPPQQETAPEEPPSPATRGSSDGLTPPPQGTHTTLAPNTNSAAPGGALMVGRAVEDTRSEPEQRASSKRGGKPATSAGSAVTGKRPNSTGTVISVDLGSSGGRGRVEGDHGLLGLLPGSSISQLPANGGPSNSASFRQIGAPDVFDKMSVRDHIANSSCTFTTEIDEVWEKGPETIIRDGSSIRAVFSSSPAGGSQTLTDSRRPLQPSQSMINAEQTQQSVVMRPPRIALEAPSGGQGGTGFGPDCVGGMGEHFASSSPAEQADRAAVMDYFARHAIADSNGVGSSGTKATR